MESPFSASHPSFFAEHGGQEFHIVVDDCVGCFLYTYQDGELINTELRSIPEEGQKLALEKFNVPLDRWHARP